MTKGEPRPRTKGRIIRNHAFAWAFVAFFPYLLALTAAAFANTGESFATWFGWSLFFLVGSVLIAAAFCTLELGMLFQFKRSRSMGRKARAVVPGVIIFVLALFVPSPAITALIPPSSTSIVPLAVIVAVAVALGTGVFASHWRHSAGPSPEMGPPGQD